MYIDYTIIFIPMYGNHNSNMTPFWCSLILGYTLHDYHKLSFFLSGFSCWFRWSLFCFPILILLRFRFCKSKVMRVLWFMCAACIFTSFIKSAYLYKACEYGEYLAWEILWYRIVIPSSKCHGYISINLFET